MRTQIDRLGIKRAFAVGILCGLVIAGCAGLSFPYKYYVMHADHYDGTLYGPKPEDDLALSVCAPNAQGQDQCIVMLKDAFLAAKKDYITCQQQLDACQSPN